MLPKDMLNAKEFMQHIMGKKIVDVEMLKGADDADCGDCQFEITLEDGYAFVV